MKWLIWVVIALVLGAGSAALVVKLNSDAFTARVAALRAELTAAAALPSTGPPELPALVRDYALRAGGAVGGPALFVLHQKAQLFTSAAQPPVALVTEQWTLTRQAGIVWSAAGSMYGLPVVVVDAFVAGRGVFDARLAATLKVAGGDGPDYDRGELMRWLSELPLHPDAILNVTDLVWQQLDARTVSVTAQSASGSNWTRARCRSPHNRPAVRPPCVSASTRTATSSRWSLMTARWIAVALPCRRCGAGCMPSTASSAPIACRAGERWAGNCPRACSPTGRAN